MRLDPPQRHGDVDPREDISVRAGGEDARDRSVQRGKIRRVRPVEDAGVKRLAVFVRVDPASRKQHGHGKQPVAGVGERGIVVVFFQIGHVGCGRQRFAVDKQGRYPAVRRNVRMDAAIILHVSLLNGRIRREVRRRRRTVGAESAAEQGDRDQKQADQPVHPVSPPFPCADLPHAESTDPEFLIPCINKSIDLFCPV